MKKSILFSLGILCMYSCAPRFEKYFIAEKDVLKKEIQSSTIDCNAFANYEPDAYTPIRYIRVNFHFMQNEQGKGNFNEQQGIQYSYELINACNNKLAHNVKMSLPENNETPVLPTQLRLVLADDKLSGKPGIYFHKDDSACYFAKNTKGLYSEGDQTPFKYAVNKDSVLNIFFIEHHPDSLKNNPNYNVTTAGVSFGKNIKIYGAFHNRYTAAYRNDGTPFYKGADFHTGVVNHEIGHSIGIGHTWKMEDGCDDTPKNAGCWGQTDTPPCNGATTNNIMDYNYCQCAITPCQLAKIHYNFWKNNSQQRSVLVQDWCDYNPFAKVIIARDSQVVWSGGKELLGDIEIREGASLTIKCILALPKGAKVIVKPGARLILDGGKITNKCDDQWQGIEVWTNKKFGIKGEVIMANGGMLEHVTTFIVEL